MASSLSNLVDNLAEGIHKIKYDCDSFLEYESVKDNLLIFTVFADFRWIPEIKSPQSIQ